MDTCRHITGRTEDGAPIYCGDASDVHDDPNANPTAHDHTFEPGGRDIDTTLDTVLDEMEGRGFMDDEPEGEAPATLAMIEGVRAHLESHPHPTCPCPACFKCRCHVFGWDELQCTNTKRCECDHVSGQVVALADGGTARYLNGAWRCQACGERIAVDGHRGCRA